MSVPGIMSRLFIGCMAVLMHLIALLINAMGLMDFIQEPEGHFIFVASNYRLGGLFNQRDDYQR